MAAFFGIFSVLLVSTSAGAAFIDGQTYATCGVFTVAQSVSFDDVIHTSRIKEVAFPRKVQVIEETGSGPRTLEFGVGKIEFRLDIDMMDPDGRIVRKPIEITAEVTYPAGASNRKRLTWNGKMFNVFTGRFESVGDDRVLHVSEKFFHMQHGMGATGSVPNGKPRHTGLICALLTKDEIGHQIP